MKESVALSLSAIAGSERPILQSESGNTVEVAGIPCHRNPANLQHSCGDAQIHPPDVQLEGDQLMIVSKAAGGNEMMGSLDSDRSVSIRL